ncbi:hypothetical protein [Acetobacter sicerae]|uniref:hypothetical protein n=1 Tax=Acetobacter sicerae TaxID=85325 RepID=UPI00156A8B95|nr:hypothetical protein [Acetobacter sicerae]NHN91961.1 hypothetical protein [Acetobacter sicerae]
MTREPFLSGQGEAVLACQIVTTFSVWKTRQGSWLAQVNKMVFPLQPEDFRALVTPAVGPFNKASRP